MQDIYQLTLPTPFQVGDVHVYLIKGDALSLVDAGVKTKDAWDALSFQLNKHGFRASDVEQIFLTHHHPDHIGLIENFPNARIIAHRYVDYWLTRDESFFQKYEQFYQQLLIKTGVPEQFHTIIKYLRAPLQYAGEGKLTHYLSEGDRLPGHEDWQVIETQGHAQSHLSFYREKNGQIISGDHLLHNTSPNPILEPPHDDQSERAKPLLQYRSNLKKCQQLGIQKVLPGHGRIFSNVDSYVQLQLNQQEKRARKVYELLQLKAQSPFAVCTQLFPKHYKNQLELTMSETIGQLDYLAKHEKIEMFIDDGVHYFRAK